MTGADGQLGTDLCRLLNRQGNEVVPLCQRDMDLTDEAAITRVIGEQAADWVVNCAAYTQVDRAETDRDLAFAVNRDGAAAIARAVSRSGGRLLQVSTDFIFDGKQSMPYGEADAAHPLGVYGQSKWEGEQAVLEHLPETLVVRTAWVHGAHGQNFVKTILRLAGEREALRVVDDQLGTPTWTGDLSWMLLELMGQQAQGVFHATNEGVASWYDLASAAVDVARELGMPLSLRSLQPIPTSDYPTAAVRPAYSVLDKRKLRAAVSRPIPHWRDGLRSMMQELQA